MFAIKPSPSKSESSSTSNTDDTSYSTESVNHLLKDIPDESPSPTQDSFAEEYSGPYPKPKPGYTRRLIRMVRIPADEVDENFDEDAWNKKVYGPDVIIVDMRSVPKGWILVDGNAPDRNAC